MQRKKILRVLLIVAIVMCNISCDQISKAIVRQNIGENEDINILNRHFTLMKVENTGAFLSVGGTLPYPIRFALLSLLPLLVLLFCLYILVVKTSASKMFVIGLGCIIGGGIGNLYDRIFHGSVTDFLHIDFVLFQTGIFNLADVSIMSGIFILVFDSLLKKRTLTLKS